MRYNQRNALKRHFAITEPNRIGVIPARDATAFLPSRRRFREHGAAGLAPHRQPALVLSSRGRNSLL